MGLSPNHDAAMPPPPPPICFPFISRKQKRRLSIGDASGISHSAHGRTASASQLARHPSFSPSTSTLTTAADNLTFHTDSEKYDEVPSLVIGGERQERDMKVFTTSPFPVTLKRGNTMKGTKKSMKSKAGYGWGTGDKEKEVEAELTRERSSSNSTLPLYQQSETLSMSSDRGKGNSVNPHRSNSKSSQASGNTVRAPPSRSPQGSLQRALERRDTVKSKDTARTKDTCLTKDSRMTSSSKSSALPRPPLMASDSASTLVGSALERKIQGDVESIPDRSVNTKERLADLRAEMEKAGVDY